MTRDLCNYRCPFWNQADESCELSDATDEDFFLNCPYYAEREREEQENVQ